MYLDVVHTGIFELFFEVGVFLQVVDDLHEVPVVVQASVLEQKRNNMSDVSCSTAR